MVDHPKFNGRKQSTMVAPLSRWRMRMGKSNTGLLRLRMLDEVWEE